MVTGCARTALIGITVLLMGASMATAAGTCDPLPAPSGRGRIVNVKSMDELRNAVERATPNTTIRLARGEYRLDRSLDIPVGGTTIAGATGNRADVMLRGEGMTERQVGVALSISASDVTIADLSISNVGYHGIQVRGEKAASRIRIHNVRIADTGQQLVKGSTDFGPLRSDDGIVECSLFEYTDHAPSDYTNGVDILSGRNWIVRDNVFRRIRGPAERNYAAGPAILFWQNSLNTLVERNLIVDSFRGIAFGLLVPGQGNRKQADGGALPDHEGGTIRSNIVVNLNAWADEGIEVTDARQPTIEHNTVLTMGKLPWAISVRFAGTAATVRNNLSTRPPLTRNGAEMTSEGNVSGAEPGWFVDPANGNVDLNGAVQVPEAARNAGAVEYRGAK